MFLVFGSFTIAAGILLVITIVTMLIDVRRRVYDRWALGMTRSDLRYVAMIGVPWTALLDVRLDRFSALV